MHISVGLMPRSAVDIVSALPKYLAQFPLWRTRLPIHLTFKDEAEELAFFQDAFQKLGKNLTEKAGEPDFIKQFISEAKKKTDK